MLAARLSEEQVAEARRLWSKGLSLIDVADALGCDEAGQKVGIYHLSPWLYSADMEAARIELRGFVHLREITADAASYVALMPTWRARIGW